MQNNVPKFASFKPKPQPSAEETSRHHKTNAEHPRLRHHSGHRSSEDAFPTETTPDVGRISVLRTRGIKQTGPSHQHAHGHVDELFKIDQQGDQDNIRYGTNSKWHIPSYREPYDSFLLGAERHRNGRATGNLLARLGREDRARLMKDGRRIAPEKPSTEDRIAHDLDEDYIPLAISRKRKRDSLGSTVLGLSYRGTSANHTASSVKVTDDGADETSNSGASSEAEASGVSESNSAMHTQLRRLQEQVKRTPSDVEGWLAYVDFQQDWVKSGLTSQGVHSSKDDTDVASKLQLAIITDALKAVSPTDSKREALARRRLDIGSRVWSREKLEKEWKDAVARSLRSPFMLLSYIRHCQSNSEAFQWDFVRDLFIEIFEALRDSGPSSITSTENPNLSSLDCALILTSFLRASGFVELAIAVWQVLIELCSNSDSTRLEPMWNSGEIRHGEAGLQAFQPSALPVKDIDQEDKIAAWAEVELEKMSQPMLPAHTADDGDNDNDLYRVVLYSDVQPFVESWPIYRLSDILGAFLTFCGLPPMLGQHDTSIGDDYNLGVPMGREVGISQRTTFLPSTSWVAYTDTMFTAGDDITFSFKDVPRDGWLVKLAANVLEETTRRSVKSSPQMGDMPEYFMALTFHLAPKSARKMAKTLLEGGESSCIRLYHSLALIEARQKGAEAADRVFILALKMSKHYSEQQPAEILGIWASWVREALTAHDVGLALRRVASIDLEKALPDLVLQDKPTQSQILRTRDHLRRIRDEALSRGEAMVAVRATQLLVTLTHLTTLDMSLTAAAFRMHLIYFEKYVSAASAEVTILHQHLAVLLYTHVTRRLAPYSPADLADALLPSVSTLPTNGLILNIYAALFTHSSRLDDRVRSAARQVLQVDRQGNNSQVEAVPAGTRSTLHDQQERARKGIIPHLFTIQSELQRMPELGSTRVSIRAAFERAISSPECRQSEHIWALYLNYECSLVPSEPGKSAAVNSKKQQSKHTAMSSAAREKAKSVFYRGLSVLPWSKDWAMRAFGTEVLRQALSGSEKQAIIEGMSGRGLRLHNETDE